MKFIRPYFLFILSAIIAFIIYSQPAPSTPYRAIMVDTNGVLKYPAMTNFFTTNNISTFSYETMFPKTSAATWRSGLGISETSTNTVIPLAAGGTGSILADPNADRILFWDDSAGSNVWMTVGANLTITDTTLSAAAAGEANTASNLGGDEFGVYRSKSGVDLRFASLLAGANITLVSNATTISIASTATGETNTASNVGAGTNIFRQKTGVDLEFKTLLPGTNIVIEATATNITINASSGGGGEANTASNVGGGVGIYTNKVGVDLQFKSLTNANGSVTITDNGNGTITLNSTAGGNVTYKKTGTNYTLVAADYIVGCTTNGLTLNLPAAATAAAGKIYVIKDESGAAGTTAITVDADGTETIDGSLTKSLVYNYQSINLYSNGTNWFIH